MVYFLAAKSEAPAIFARFKAVGTRVAPLFGQGTESERASSDVDCCHRYTRYGQASKTKLDGLVCHTFQQKLG